MGNKISVQAEFEKLLEAKSASEARDMIDKILQAGLTDEMIKTELKSTLIKQLISTQPTIYDTVLTECINNIFFYASSTKILEEREIIHLHNNLRLVTCFLPPLHEAENSQLSKELLWKKSPFPQEKEEHIKNETSVLMIDECLALKLLQSLGQLLFYPEFTKSKVQITDKKIYNFGEMKCDSNLLWKLHNNNTNPNDNAKYTKNRIKVLECLLACFSSKLFQPLNPRERSGDPWLHFYVSPCNPLLLPTLMSLFNYGLSFVEESTIPYKKLLLGDDEGEKLALLSLHIFGLLAEVLVDQEDIKDKISKQKEYKQIIRYYLMLSQNKKEINVSDINLLEEGKKIFKNGSKQFIENINNTEYFHFISENVFKILKNPYDCENTFLPESNKRTSLLEEIMLVFWRVLDQNKNYLNKIYYHEEFIQIFVYLLYQIHENFIDSARNGVFYLSVLLISKLSTADRMFSLQLRKKYLNDIAFPKAPIFVGNHIDLLFVVLLHGMIESFVKHYFCYQNNLLAILSNVAPYAKDLSSVACSLLFQLVKAISRPEVLSRDRNNLLILRKSLNLIHKIICYQPETNPNLVYELVIESKEIEYLKKLPLKRIFPQPKSQNEEVLSIEKIEKEQVPPSNHVQPIVSEKQSESQGEKRLESEETKENPSENQHVVNEIPEGQKIQGIDEIIENKEVQLKIDEEQKVQESAPKEDALNESKILNESQIIRKPNGLLLFDERWMELYAFNLANDLIFSIADYLRTQIKLIVRENSDKEDEMRQFIKDHSLVGIIPQPGPIMIEVVNDPDKIDSILFLFLWHQIYVKTTDLPNFEIPSIKLLNLREV